MPLLAVQHHVHPETLGAMQHYCKGTVGLLHEESDTHVVLQQPTYYQILCRMH